MPRFLVVADDLTGAHDCAARLAGLGGPVPVARQASALRGAEGSPALVLDAETRFLRPDQARWLSARAWSALGQVACAPWRFQKLDSTLRGNPGAEVEGFAMATSAPWVAVLPAYPRAGRQVLGGRLQVHGVPLLRTEYAQDPLSPARLERPQDLFEARLTMHVPLRWIAGGAAALARRLSVALARRRPRFVTFDCSTDRDVDSIARAALGSGCRHFAGASALAGSLAEAVGGQAVGRTLPPAGLHWMVLAGSVSEQSFRQLRAAQERLPWRRTQNAPALPELRRLWRQGSLALSTVEGRHELGKSAGARSRAGEPAIDALVRTALQVAPLGPRSAYFLTGGHTAQRFFAAAALERLDVMAEALPGLALGLARGPRAEAWVATKPGGFGSDDLFERFLGQVRAR